MISQSPIWLREAAAGLLDLLYPPRCVVCREPGPERFCDACRRSVLPAEPRQERGSALDGRACVGLYDGPLREAVILLKYHDRRALADDLGALLAEVLQERREEWRPDALVPVPIHWIRRRERGYNQTELLARAVEKRCGLQVREALERVKNTRPLVGLSLQERRREVHDSIRPRAGVGPGCRPVLIDDVQTSGSTLEVCAAWLRIAGAHTVYALTVCWQPADGRTGQRAAARREGEPLPYRQGLSMGR